MEIVADFKEPTLEWMNAVRQKRFSREIHISIYVEQQTIEVNWVPAAVSKSHRICRNE